ncbi:hypothetical protein XENOCAPTIV_006190 [Xenoophorus captivus]|uniref:Uncharacterized protein n=1 Tax=Xenoophorus captivus TaxID=1517983 RepID=A0ABV0QLF5_9TELE
MAATCITCGNRCNCPVALMTVYNSLTHIKLYNIYSSIHVLYPLLLYIAGKLVPFWCQSPAVIGREADKLYDIYFQNSWKEMQRNTPLLVCIATSIEPSH